MDEFIKELDKLIEDIEGIPSPDLSNGINPAFGIAGKLAKQTNNTTKRGRKWRYRDDQGNDLGTNPDKIVKDHLL